jgi:hypothetical protein
MLDQWAGALRVDGQLARNQRLIVVRPLGAIAAGVAAQSIKDHSGIALQLEHGCDSQARFQRPCLTDVARQAVHQQPVVRAGASLGNEPIEDLLSEVKGLVFQQGAFSQNPVEEREVLGRESLARSSRRSGAQMSAKVEVVARASP